MGVPGPDGKDVELAVGQVVQRRNGDTCCVIEIGDVNVLYSSGMATSPSGHVSCDPVNRRDEDIIRVIAHQREEPHDDGTTTRVVTLPVTLPDTVWARNDAVAVRLSRCGDVLQSGGGTITRIGSDCENGNVRLILRPKVPPIDPNVMALVEAIEAGECEIPSRATAIEVDRGFLYVHAGNYCRQWSTELEGSIPRDFHGFTNGFSIDLTEVRRLLEERAAE